MYKLSEAVGDRKMVVETVKIGVEVVLVSLPFFIQKGIAIITTMIKIKG